MILELKRRNRLKVQRQKETSYTCKNMEKRRAKEELEGIRVKKGGKLEDKNEKQECWLIAGGWTQAKEEEEKS